MAYYAIQSEKDELTNRRRLAGFGLETIARDLSTGPHKVQARDLKINGITFNRRLDEFQKNSWNWRTCGKRKDFVQDRAPLVNGPTVLTPCGVAFEQLSAETKSLLARSYGWGTEGQSVAALAAFCQIAKAIPAAAATLDECDAVKADFAKMRQKYCELKKVMDETSTEVNMPDIDQKTATDLESLYVMASTWEGGGRPVHIKCNVFIRTLGYCVKSTYGELLISTYLHIPEAEWASSVMVQFLRPIATAADETVVAAEIKAAVQACRFYKRECDLRVWFHRFGDHLASLVAGILIAVLVSLGSTSGSWVATTAAAIADPKPVAGYTSAAWGYPKGRRAHLEARPDPAVGDAIVALRSQNVLRSLQPLVLQDIAWQLAVGSCSVLALVFKFEIRDALGFGVFEPPTEWILRLCLATATLAVLIDLQLVHWAWTTGGTRSFAHASFMVLLEVAVLVPRYIWRDPDVTASTIMNFWLADASVWVHCLLCGAFSVYLSQTSEYPAMGWMWPSAWLLAFASCGAGVPRAIPPVQRENGTVTVVRTRV